MFAQVEYCCFFLQMGMCVTWLQQQERQVDKEGKQKDVVVAECLSTALQWCCHSDCCHIYMLQACNENNDDDDSVHRKVEGEIEIKKKREGESQDQATNNVAWIQEIIFCLPSRLLQSQQRMNDKPGVAEAT